MDDTRTQQALDELADLFLSGQAPANPSQDTPAPPADEAKPGPGDALTGPAPIRLGPKLRGQAQPPVTPPAKPPAPAIDPQTVEGNAPLRLHTDASDPLEPDDLLDETEAAEDFSIDDEPQHAVAIEAVMLGNLPGLSGPWLTQYAQLLAQQEGPVAILHIDDDLIDLELVEPTDPESDSRGVSLRMPPGGGQIDPVTVLDALLASHDTAPGTILVHVDPLNDQQGLTRALTIDDWTVMCGADDLAIVGGYGMLKRMVEDNPDVAGKRVGLMIMGSDPKDSQAAARKFQSAAESFLETPVQLLGWQKQMVPVNLRHLGRFEDVQSAWPRLARWFERCEASEIQLVEEPIFQNEPAPTPDYQPPAPPKPVPAPAALGHRETPPRFQPRQRPEPSVPTPALAEPAAVYEAPQPIEPPPAPKPQPIEVAPAPQPQPRPEPEPQVELAIDEPDLVELLMAGPGEVPGGIAMEARCPHQPNTQLMLDQAGRLHLLHRHDSEADGLEGLQPAMVDLLQARKWVYEHIELLQLTQRQLSFDYEAEPVLHLFTDRADWATALATRLGEALKLHLLQAVEVGDQQAWFCTPLN